MHASEAGRSRLTQALSTYGRRPGAAAIEVLDAVAARPLAILAGLAVVQWLCILAYALTVRHNGWLFYQGGDQIWLVTTGWLLGDGELAPTRVGYGWPLALAPVTVVTGPSFVSAMPPVIAFNVLVLGPLALWAVYGLAARLAGRVLGLVAAAGWVVAPFAVIPLWRDDYHERYVEQFLPGALGLSGLADYQSMVLLLVAALLFVRGLDGHTWTELAAAGLVAGLAVGTKPSNGLFLAAPAVAALLARRLGTLLPFALALVPALLTLALWKQRGLGTLPAFALERTHLAATAAASVPALDRYIDLNWGVLQDNADHLREYFWSARLLEWLPLAGAIGAARRSLPVAGLLATWFAAFLVVKGTTPLSTVSSGTFFRFLMPAFPAYFLLAVGTVLLVPTLGTHLVRRWPIAEPRLLGRRAIAALAVALAIVPLLVIALVRPIDSPAKAILVDNILTAVDDRIDVTVRPEGESRLVEWTHPPAGRSDVFYRVFRTDLSGVDVDCVERDGAAECPLEMILLGTTREPRWRDGSPPEGALYRIGVAANSRDDPAGGDVATISPAVAAG